MSLAAGAELSPYEIVAFGATINSCNGRERHFSAIECEMTRDGVVPESW
jgi:hypothetical protein